MAKIILLVIICWLIYSIIKKYARSVEKDVPSPKAAPEIMVQCRHCGLHLPESDSVKSGEDHFCCQAHQQQARHEPKS